MKTVSRSMNRNSYCNEIPGTVWPVWLWLSQRLGSGGEVKKKQHMSGSFDSRAREMLMVSHGSRKDINLSCACQVHLRTKPDFHLEKFNDRVHFHLSKERCWNLRAKDKYAWLSHDS